MSVHKLNIINFADKILQTIKKFSIWVFSTNKPTILCDFKVHYHTCEKCEEFFYAPELYLKGKNEARSNYFGSQIKLAINKNCTNSFEDFLGDKLEKNGFS